VSETSPAQQVVARLVARFGKAGAHAALDRIFSQLSVTELALLAHDWRGLWARPKQLPPPGPWRSWGFLAARAYGKTRSIAEFVNEEVREGRAGRVSLMAQNEDKSIEIHVEGNSGLIKTASPWCRPRWVSSSKQLVWPNGSLAQVLTPEVPGGARGPEFHLSWISEVQSWPVATRYEAYTNVLLATRLGNARLVWDATPRVGHPILKDLVARAKEDPARHIVATGTTYENAANLGAGVIDDLEREFGGTQKGDEELGGIMRDEADDATAQMVWIEKARRPAPEGYAYRALGVDPAVTVRAGSDRTGIVDAGRGVDGQAYINADQSGKHTPPAWAKIVIDRVTQFRIDVVVVETNKGGDLVTQNLRAAAQQRGLVVIVVGKDEKPRHQPGKIFVKEVHSRGPKADRNQPLSTAYERGRVSHVIGVDLSTLETTLTTWSPTPGSRSPDDLDACGLAVGEVLDLKSEKPDKSEGFKGIEQMGKALGAAPGPAASGRLAALFTGGGGGGKI